MSESPPERTEREKPKLYVLDEHRNVVRVPGDDFEVWTAWHEEAQTARTNVVAETVIGEGEDVVRVFTRFNGVHATWHQYSDEAGVFETTVFGGPCTGERTFNPTWGLAESHHHMVAQEQQRLWHDRHTGPK